MLLSIPTLEFVQALFKFQQFPIQILPKIFPKWIWIIPKLVPKRTKIDAKCWRSIQERPRGAQLVAKSSQEALFAQSWLQLGFRNLPKWRASRKKIDVKKQVDFDLIFSSFPLRFGSLFGRFFDANLHCNNKKDILLKSLKILFLHGENRYFHRYWHLKILYFQSKVVCFGGHRFRRHFGRILARFGGAKTHDFRIFFDVCAKQMGLAGQMAAGTQNSSQDRPFRGRLGSLTRKKLSEPGPATRVYYIFIIYYY